jgi:hypothetical protein
MSELNNINATSKNTINSGKEGGRNFVAKNEQIENEEEKEAINEESDSIRTSLINSKQIEKRQQQIVRRLIPQQLHSNTNVTATQKMIMDDDDEFNEDFEENNNQNNG